MSEVSYHGWTHRPKRLGGTDPIPQEETVTGIEWYYVDSLTNWSGTTVLDFNERNGSWDPTGPTFSVNASGNLEIAKDGVYVGWMFVVGGAWIGAPTTTRSVRLEVAKISGESPAVAYHGWGAGAYNDIVRSAVEWATPTSIAATKDTKPQGFDLMVFSPGTFPGTGPCEISWRGTSDEDGTPTSDTDVVFHWVIIRLGDEWVTP